jgi:hypothetical protein
MIFFFLERLAGKRFRPAWSAIAESLGLASAPATQVAACAGTIGYSRRPLGTRK